MVLGTVVLGFKRLSKESHGDIMYKVIIFVVVAAMGLCLYVFINEARPLIRSTPGPTRRMPVRGQLNRILKEETATKEEEGTTRRVVLVVYVAHPIALSSLAAVRRAYAPATSTASASSPTAATATMPRASNGALESPHGRRSCGRRNSAACPIHGTTARRATWSCSAVR